MLLENNPYPADVRVRREAESLVEAGHRVCVSAPRAPGQSRRELVHGVEVRRFRAPAGRGGAASLLAEYLIANVALHAAAARELRRGATVLHLHNPPDTLFMAALAARALGRRVVFDHHDPFPELVRTRSGSPALRAIASAGERASFGAADLVLAANESLAEIARSRGRKPASAVRVVRNGPPATSVGRAPSLRPGSLADPRLVYVGAIANQDGVELLADMLAELRDAHGLSRTSLTVVGDGPARGRVEARMAKLGVARQVRFTGWVDYDRVWDHVHAADICVDPAPPSELNHLSTMVKIAEYLAAGKPVAAFALHETACTAGDAALLAAQGDPAKLAAIVAALAGDGDRRSALARRALARASTLTWETSARQLLGAYEQLDGARDDKRPLSASSDGRTPLKRRPLRVCMVHYYDFHVDSRLQREARALAERGDEVDVVCLGEPGELRVGAGTLRLHRARASKQRGGPGSYLAGYGRFFASALLQVSRLHRRRRFDVVSIHNVPDFVTFAALMPKLDGAQIVLDMHDPLPELSMGVFGISADHWLVRLLKLEERLSASIVDAAVMPHRRMMERLQSRGVRLRRWQVVHNSPDEQVFGPRRQPVAIPEQGPIRVVYHGGVTPRYGVETLVRAFATLRHTVPRAVLDIYGLFEQIEEIAALAGEVAPDRIRVAPSPTPFEEMPAKLAGAHIGVVPNPRNGFTDVILPVKLLEYVHLGIPVVSTRLPLIDDYFGSEAVSFFRSDSPESLADAIADVCRNPQDAAARARTAGERLDELEWSAERAGYLDFIDELAALSRRRR